MSGQLDTYATTLAAACLAAEEADLPALMGQLMALAAAPEALPAVLVAIVCSGRSAIGAAAAGDHDRAHIARWELDYLGAPTE